MNHDGYRFRLTPGELERCRTAATRLDLHGTGAASRMTDVEETTRAFADCDFLADRLRPRSSASLAFGWFRLVLLEPSQQIVLHRDPPIAGTRYHLPLWSGANSWTYYDGMWRQLLIGGCYQMDPTQPHGAVNWSDQVRIHLLMDVEAV